MRASAWATACGSWTTSPWPPTAGTLGRLASLVRDRRIPLELCPTSNVAQRRCGARSPSTRSGCCAELRFRVTVNTDNRLMSDTSLSKEMTQLVEAFGWGWDRLEWLTTNAMKSSFLGFEERGRLIEDVVKPAYRDLRDLATP